MREWRRIGCGVLIGAAVAFPAGMMFAGRDEGGKPPPTAGKRPPEEPPSRNFYAPGVTKDPYVLDQQRQVVEGLEMECRQLGEHCAEAEAARRWLSEQDAD